MPRRVALLKTAMLYPTLPERAVVQMPGGQRGLAVVAGETAAHGSAEGTVGAAIRLVIADRPARVPPPSS